MGPKGVLTVSGNEVTVSPQLGIDTRPSYYSASFPRQMHADYVAQWHSIHDAELPTARSPKIPSINASGPGDDTLHMGNFFAAVKSRKPVVEDAVFGNHAALACHMANESYFRKSPVTFDSASHRIV